MKPQKQRKCRQCKELYTPSNSLVKVCGMACALDYGKSIVKIKKAKDEIKQKRDFLANDKSFQRAKAQKAFNEFIRLRDKSLSCISCDKPSDWNGQWHASHFKTVGSRPDLRFNEDNCHKSCSVCNNYLSGNIGSYTLALERKIGAERLAALELDSGLKKYTASDYAAIHAEYSAKIKEFKK